MNISHLSKERKSSSGGRRLTTSGGLSGALVVAENDSVFKLGEKCKEQAEYAKLINVGPEIYSMVPTGYMMERLYHEPLNGVYEHEIFKAMVATLSKQVWCRRHAQNNWRHDLELFVTGVNREIEIVRMMKEFFPARDHFGVYIHGDPTLSNVMATADGEIKLIDPIRPQGKVPWMIEVDVGKMLQSVIGWEHVVFGWDMPDKFCIEFFDHCFSEGELRRAMFWLMIHAMRILPYANKKMDVVAAEWATYVYEYINRNIWRDTSCSMLSTLMEHSRIQGMRYWPHIAQSESSLPKTSSERLGGNGSTIR